MPAIPPLARELPADIAQVTPSDYRNPPALPPGGVLIVGASATGLQIAEEIQLAGGRAVTRAVGCHTRLPRTCRGRDIWCWLEAIGVLDDLWHEVRDIARERHKPSFQLVGRPDRRTLDLAAMQAAGVRVAGHLQGVAGGTVHLADDLPETLAGAQAALERLLTRIDAHADSEGAPVDFSGARPIVLPPAPTAIDLVAENIRSVVWATGYRHDYRWLNVPVLDAAGEIIHEGGVTRAPGLYVLGLRVLAIDRGEYGADTISTHALMRDAVTQLHRWGVLPAIVRRGTPPVRRVIFRYGTETEEVENRRTLPVASALSFPRRRLIWLVR